MAHEQVCGVEVHGEGANDEVSTGQAQQEVVVDCLELCVDLEGDEYQQVACHCGQRQEARGDRSTLERDRRMNDGVLEF